MVPLEQDRQAPQVAIPDGLHQATVACFVHNRNTGSVTKGYGALFGYSVARFFSSATEEPMNRRTEEPFSPDPAGRGGDHRLANLTSVSALELRHVRYYAVDPISARGVRIHLNQHPRCLRPHILAPDLSPTQKEPLLGG